MIRATLRKLFPCLQREELCEDVQSPEQTMLIQVAWGRKVSEEFCLRVIAMCIRNGWNPIYSASYLMACMAFETGRTFSPFIRNMAGSGATGLIQFMPATARGLGTTTEELAKMRAEDQLEYVEKHFQPYARRIETCCDFYMAIFLPKYIGASDDIKLFSQGSTGYTQNRGLDRDRKGFITKGDACFQAYKHLSLGLEKENVEYFEIPEPLHWGA